MATYKDINSFFEERGPEDIERFVDKNLDISQQIYAILKKKGWSQKDLAQKLEKSDAEISKWLSGTHNLTLRSITRVEAILGCDIILTPLKAASTLPEKIKYVAVEVPASINQPLFFEKINDMGYYPGRLHDVTISGLFGGKSSFKVVTNRISDKSKLQVETPLQNEQDNIQFVQAA